MEGREGNDGSAFVGLAIVFSSQSKGGRRSGRYREAVARPGWPSRLGSLADGGSIRNWQSGEPGGHQILRRTHGKDRIYCESAAGKSRHPRVLIDTGNR